MMALIALVRKMIMKEVSVIFTIILILFTGCSSDMEKAKIAVVCKNHGGFHRIAISTFQCKDGATFYRADLGSIYGTEVTEELNKILEN